MFTMYYLNEDSRFINPDLFVHLNNSTCAIHGLLRVKAQPSIYL